MNTFKSSSRDQKNIFLYILFILILVVMCMPFFTTFNDILTRIVISLDFFKIIQNIIVPWELRMVGVILYPFGFQPEIVGDYLAIEKGSLLLIEIAWNCIGWQSLIFFVLTSWIGFQGSQYTNRSKGIALSIGILGTFIINLLRIVLVVVTAYYFGQSAAGLLHDYGSTFIIIIWLFVYWWFVYGYVLEERGSGDYKRGK